MSEEDRNEHLSAIPGLMRLGVAPGFVAVLEDRACACPAPGRGALLVKYTATRGGRCRACGGIWQPRARRHPWRALAGHLAFPFRRDGIMAREQQWIWCVQCTVQEELTPGEQDIQSAELIIDGMSVCAAHGAQMITVLADRARA